MFTDAIKQNIHPTTWAVCGIKGKGASAQFAHRGTAFAVDTHGHLVTCWHVTYMDQDCTVECDEYLVVQPELGINVRLPATLVNKERDRDIALLKIAAEAKTTPVWWSSDKVPFGRSCCAFGHPLSVADPATQSLRIFSRAAAGIVSMPYSAARFPGCRPIDLYELDFFTHGGASGAPVFGRSGDVFSFVSGSLLLDDGSGTAVRSNLSVAISAHEAIEFLEALHVNLQVRRSAKR